MRSPLLAVALCLPLVACTGYPDPDPNRPSAPSENDPAFTAQGLDSWYLIGDGATPGSNQLTAIITAPDGTDYVDMYIPTMKPIRMIAQDGAFAVDVSIKELPVGAHEVLFSANGSKKAFAAHTLNRSAAYYVLVTTDYDFSDPGITPLGYMDKLHADHPEMMITHFWAPYTYTDPEVTEPRRAELTAWIQKQHDEHGDEIGLHIHPWCNFVEAAGVTCVTDKSTTEPAGDPTGYTINLSSAYMREPMVQLLEYAKTVFNQRGLPTPVTFRAGGWTADLNTLLALNDAGFVADTSALNWARIEEWDGYELYNWTMTHWNPINDTSQPYHPSMTNALASDAPSMGLLEVPDNGVMIDYVTSQEMIGLFTTNWDGQPFETPRTLMMGFHPSPRMPNSEYYKVNDLLFYADGNLAKLGKGPVVYITLSDVTAAFPAP